MAELPVLQYYKFHPHISDNATVSVSAFESQLKILKQNGYNSISCKQLTEYLLLGTPLPSNPVLLTFDHGHITHYEYGQHILKEQGFFGTFFIVGEWALMSLHEKPEFCQYMHTEHLRDLQRSENEIALHGFSHINFRYSPLSCIHKDIQENIKFFNEVDLKYTRSVAYPFGVRPPWFKRPIMQNILWRENIELGFKLGNTINNLKSIDRYGISRVAVKGTDTEEEFLTKLRTQRQA